MRALLLVLGGLLACGIVDAHTGSSTFIELRAVGNGNVEAHFDVALRDLNQLVPLDANADGTLTWGEVERARASIESEVLTRSRLSASGKACVQATQAPLSIAQHGDGPYVRIGVRSHCTGESLELDHSGWFEFDSAHRGLLEFVDGSGKSAQFVLTQLQPRWRAATSPGQRLADFLVEGVRHLVTGYDHLAFLSVLLLALLRRRRADEPVSLHASTRGAAAVITAFTAAHSLTLALAATGRIVLPSQPVEVAIAASVLCAALLNLSRRTAQHGWPLAFAFGLIHGLGFAGALAELAGRQIDWLALAAFNAGIEIAQLAIAAVAVPLLWWLFGSANRERIGVPAASAATAALAAIWVGERVLA